MRYVSVLQDYTNFITSQNLDYKMFKMRWKWSVWFIRYCLFEIVTLQKIRKNKDANHIYGHFLEIRTLICCKT